MSTTATKSVDLDAVKESLVERVEQLSARRQELALDAFTKPSAKTELASVEKKLAAAEAELNRLDLARDELERRQTPAEEAEASAHRAAALEKARRLQSHRQGATEAVDAAAAALAEAIADYVDVCREQQRALIDSGWSGKQAHIARPIGYAIEGSLALAVRQSTIPARLLLAIGSIELRTQRSLAEADPRPVQPFGHDESTDPSPQENA